MSIENEIVQQLIKLTKKKKLKWYGLGSDVIGYEAPVNNPHRLTIRMVGSRVTLLWSTGESKLVLIDGSPNWLNELYRLVVDQNLLYTQSETFDLSILRDALQGLEKGNLEKQSPSLKGEDEEPHNYRIEFTGDDTPPWTICIKANILNMTQSDRQIFFDILNLCDGYTDDEDDDEDDEDDEPVEY